MIENKGVCPLDPLPFKQRVPGSSPGRLTKPPIRINGLRTYPSAGPCLDPLRFEGRWSDSDTILIPAVRAMILEAGAGPGSEEVR